MIVGVHCTIRTAEPDDVNELRRLYDPACPRAVFIDRTYELHFPSRDELTEMLRRRDLAQHGIGFLAIEDQEGFVRGFCMLRAVNNEARYAELFLGLIDPADFTQPLADEAYDYLYRRAFKDLRLRKMVAHCLDTEQDFRAFLQRKGFSCDGVQRQMVYTLGAHHDLETYTLSRPTEN